MNPGDAGRGQGAARRQATVLESVEEIRAQIRGMAREADRCRRSTVTLGGAEQDTTAYRPSLRPSMALLYVLDDGDDSGEIVRIRASSFVIGRVEGNLTIPHDGGISGRHAEISRRYENGEHCWYLKDLQSTNGTFVRASTVILSHEQEVLIGGGRFRFEVPDGRRTRRPVIESAANATRKWESLVGFADGRGVAAGARRHFPWASRAAVPASRARTTGWAAIQASARSWSMIRWWIAGTRGSIATKRTAGSLRTPGRATGSGRGSRKSASAAAGSFSAASNGFSSRLFEANGLAIWPGRVRDFTGR